MNLEELLSQVGHDTFEEVVDTSAEKNRYVPSRKKWGGTERIYLDQHIYTQFPGGFEACVQYDEKLDLGERDENKRNEDFRRWKKSAGRFDTRAVFGKTFFSQFSNSKQLSQKDAFYAYYYSADYSVFNGSTCINLNAVSEDGSSFVIHVEGFRPYLYVGVPDTWVDHFTNLYPNEDITPYLEVWVRLLHHQLQSVLSEQHGKSYRFKEFNNKLLYDLPDSGIIQSAKDLLGLTLDERVPVFKIEVVHPQVIPLLRQLLWTPFGGVNNYGAECISWYDSQILLPPCDITTINRSDRIWMKEKREELEKQGKSFDPYHYIDDPERDLFFKFNAQHINGETPRFTVYEANVDFTIRFIVDTKLLSGWIKVGPEFSYVDGTNGTQVTCDREIITHYTNLSKVQDPTNTVPKDPVTKKFVRDFTKEEKYEEGLLNSQPPLTVASIDMEMTSRAQIFPDSNICLIDAIGVKMMDLQTKKRRRFFFCLGEPTEEIKNSPKCVKNPQKDYPCHFDYYGDVWMVERELGTFFYYYNETDKLRDFCLFWMEMRFHMLYGWNINAFDITYIIRRCQVLGIVEGRSLFQRDPMRDLTWSTSELKKRLMVDIKSQSFVLDLMVLMRDTHNNWDSHKLGYAASKVIGKTKADLDYAFLEMCQHEGAETRECIHHYLATDIDLPEDIMLKEGVIPTLEAFSEIQACTLQNIVSNGSQAKVYAGILYYKKNKMDEKNIIGVFPTFPRKPKNESKNYKGARVFEPCVGMHNDIVATLDFASLYPSIIMCGNLDYMTLITKWAILKFGLVEGVHYHQCPDVGYDGDELFASELHFDQNQKAFDVFDNPLATEDASLLHQLLSLKIFSFPAYYGKTVPLDLNFYRNNNVIVKDDDGNPTRYLLSKKGNHDFAAVKIFDWFDSEGYKRKIKETDSDIKCALHSIGTCVEKLNASIREYNVSLDREKLGVIAQNVSVLRMRLRDSPEFKQTAERKLFAGCLEDISKIPESYKCPRYIRRCEKKLPNQSIRQMILLKNKYNPSFALKDVETGLLPAFELELKEQRSAVKKIMFQCELEMVKLKLLVADLEKDPSSVEKLTEVKKQLGVVVAKLNNLNAKQLAIKLYMNSIYGFLGAPDSLLPLMYAAIVICKKGQQFIKMAQEYVESVLTITNGYCGDAKVIYGDTDSIMFKLINKQYEPTRNEMMAIGSQMSDLCTKNVFPKGLQLAFEKIYVYYLLIAKKHYIGLFCDITDITKRDVKGLKPKRKDTIQLINHAFDIMWQKTFIEKDPTAAISAIQELFRSIYNHEVPLSELKQSFSISKDLSVAHKLRKENKLVMTPGLAMAFLREERTGQTAFMGERFTSVVKKRIREDPVKKSSLRGVNESREDPNVMIRENIPYDEEHYMRFLFSNIAPCMGHILGKSEKEMRKLFMEQDFSKTKQKQILKRKDSVTQHFHINHDRCPGCHTVFHPKRETKRRKIEFDLDEECFGGNNTNAIIETEYNRSQKYCTDCSNFSRKEAAKVKYDSLIQKNMELWNKCQSCTARKIADNVVMACTNTDCRTYYARRDTLNMLEQSTRDIEDLF